MTQPGLANIRALFLNKEDENWITRRELNFKLISSHEKSAPNNVW